MAVMRLLMNRPATTSQQDFQRWVEQCFAEIERSSYNLDARQIAQDFTVTNSTPLRSLDASTATLADLRNFVATFITDLKQGGMKKTQ